MLNKFNIQGLFILGNIVFIASAQTLAMEIPKLEKRKNFGIISEVVRHGNARTYSFTLSNNGDSYVLSLLQNQNSFDNRVDQPNAQTTPQTLQSLLGGHLAPLLGFTMDSQRNTYGQLTVPALQEVLLNTGRAHRFYFADGLVPEEEYIRRIGMGEMPISNPDTDPNGSVPFLNHAHDMNNHFAFQLLMPENLWLEFSSVARHHIEFVDFVRSRNERLNPMINQVLEALSLRFDGFHGNTNNYLAGRLRGVDEVVMSFYVKPETLRTGRLWLAKETSHGGLVGRIRNVSELIGSSKLSYPKKIALRQLIDTIGDLLIKKYRYSLDLHIANFNTLLDLLNDFVVESIQNQPLEEESTESEENAIKAKVIMFADFSETLETERLSIIEALQTSHIDQPEEGMVNNESMNVPQLHQVQAFILTAFFQYLQNAERKN